MSHYLSLHLIITLIFNCNFRVPVYKNLLLNFLSDVSSMKFACSKILNLIKNMTAENSVPNITYDLFCETVVDKISAAGNFFTNNIEDIAHILTQFIVFPFEHKNYLKMVRNKIIFICYI